MYTYEKLMCYEKMHNKLQQYDTDFCISTENNSTKAFLYNYEKHSNRFQINKYLSW